MGPGQVALMFAVGYGNSSRVVVAHYGKAALYDLQEHDQSRILTWFYPPKSHGLWVRTGTDVGGTAHWGSEWRRATTEEAARFAAGEVVWP